MSAAVYAQPPVSFAVSIDLPHIKALRVAIDEAPSNDALKEWLKLLILHGCADSPAGHGYRNRETNFIWLQDLSVLYCPINLTRTGASAVIVADVTL